MYDFLLRAMNIEVRHSQYWLKSTITMTYKLFVVVVESFQKVGEKVDIYYVTLNIGNLYFRHLLCFSYNCIVDPLGQPTVRAGRDNCFCICCPSVRPSPLFNSSKTKQQKTMIATGETVDLAEWIIDDTCLVIYWFF